MSPQPTKSVWQTILGDNPGLAWLFFALIGFFLSFPLLAESTAGTLILDFLFFGVLIFSAYAVSRKRRVLIAAIVLALPTTAFWIVLLAVGVCSSVAGVASGIFAIPYLARFALPMRTIIGTSTAAAAIYSTFGAIGYIGAGWTSADLPAGSLGYVYLPAFAILAVTAAAFTPLGVRLAHRLNDRILRRSFALFLLIAAVVIVFL